MLCFVKQLKYKRKLPGTTIFVCFGFYGPFKNISLISSRSSSKVGGNRRTRGKKHLTIRKQNLVGWGGGGGGGAGRMQPRNYYVAYEETQSNRVSDFREFVFSLFPKAILFYFYYRNNLILL